MSKGRNAAPTPLPKAFSSWKELYDAWENFRKDHKRSAKPSRSALFAETYGVPEWIIGTIPYVFRQAKRDDEIGEYARRSIELVEQGKLGLPKANNEIRAFAQQNPMFRDADVQRKALIETLKRLRDLTPLTNSIRNLSVELTVEELEEMFQKIGLELRKVQQLKNRISLALRERKERS